MIPFMVIYCKTDEEKTELLKILEEHGYKWNGDNVAPSSLQTTAGNYIYLYKNEYGKLIRYASTCDDTCFADFDYIMDDLPNIL